MDHDIAFLESDSKAKMEEFAQRNVAATRRPSEIVRTSTRIMM